jgi:hypothetical protein
MEPSRTFLVALAVALFAWLLYVPPRNAFVWDDVILIGNPICVRWTRVVKRIFTTNFWDASDATSGVPSADVIAYTTIGVRQQAGGFSPDNIIQPRRGVRHGVWCRC